MIGDEMEHKILTDDMVDRCIKSMGVSSRDTQVLKVLLKAKSVSVLAAEIDPELESLVLNPILELLDIFISRDELEPIIVKLMQLVKKINAEIEILEANSRTLN